jgi:hypothetical protein
LQDQISAWAAQPRTTTSNQKDGTKVRLRAASAARHPHHWKFVRIGQKHQDGLAVMRDAIAPPPISAVAIAPIPASAITIAPIPISAVTATLFPGNIVIEPVEIAIYDLALTMIEMSVVVAHAVNLVENKAQLSIQPVSLVPSERAVLDPPFYPCFRFMNPGPDPTAPIIWLGLARRNHPEQHYRAHYCQHRFFHDLDILGYWFSKHSDKHMSIIFPERDKRDYDARHR